MATKFLSSIPTTLMTVYKSEFWMNFILGIVAILVGLFYAHGTSDYFTKDWALALGTGSFFITFFGNFVLRTFAAGSREKSGARTKEIYAATMALKQRREIDQKIERFLSFLKKESQYNVRMLDIGNEEWEYNISPVRDDNGNPKFLDDEFTQSYLIKVNEVANYSVISEDELKKYETSPIRVSEYYFCSFYNEDWHMNDQDGPGGYRFRFSSKIGECKLTQNANSFLGLTSIDETKFTKIDDILVDSSGLLSSSGTPISIYLGKDENLYLKYFNSLLKKVYFRNCRESPNEWFLEIDYPEGYASGETLENLLNTLQARFKECGVKPKMLPWFKIAKVLKRNG